MSVSFIQKRPKYNLELVFKDDAGVERKSEEFKKGTPVHWGLDMFVSLAMSALTVGC